MRVQFLAGMLERGGRCLLVGLHPAPTTAAMCRAESVRRGPAVARKPAHRLGFPVLVDRAGSRNRHVRAKYRPRADGARAVSLDLAAAMRPCRLPDGRRAQTCPP